MKRMPLQVAYSDDYLRWQLGDGHPTDPVRAKLCVDLLRRVAPDVEVCTGFPHNQVTWDLLRPVHDNSYLHRIIADGRADEWEGVRPDLSAAALSLAKGTFSLYTMMRSAERCGVYFNPMGAKHHAMRDRSSGFCVYNDMAAVAMDLNSLGKRVLYIDWDVHHGDGVEALTRGSQLTMTASIHGAGIFPGTGLEHEPENHVYNYPLSPCSGTTDLLASLNAILYKAKLFEPDVVLLAMGADGLAEDPLGNLCYTTRGLAQAGKTLGAWAGLQGLSVLAGGAGGYLPKDQTPVTWAATILALHEAHSKAQVWSQSVALV